MDKNTTLEELKTATRKFCEDRDWLQFHTPKNLSMAISAEAGELLEQFLWLDGDASVQASKDPLQRAAIAEELADVVIFCLQMANVTDVDLASAIRKKIDQNATKYPVDKARGNAKKYTKL